MAASLSASLLLPKLPFLSPNPNPNLSFKRTLISLPPLAASGGASAAPETDCPVPPEQQPVNEYQTLVSSLPFNWATSDLKVYISRLVTTGATFALFVGLPVAAKGDPRADVAHVLLGATSAGILAVTVAVVRIYLGWAYVGNRLLSATVEYEETGWYDGQTWVKTPEVLARDRLLGSFTVKPILDRVKFTLLGLAVSLVLCIVLFVNSEKPKDLSENVNGNVSNERAIPGKYSDESARSFEPDAFCGEPDLS